MKTRTSEVLSSIALHVLGWTLAALLFVLLRCFGLESLEAFQDVDLTSLNQRLATVQTLIAGILLGGLVPLFKAGMNSGTVTVAEVGEIKREIAFHGDVLNTAARIQSRCNEFGKTPSSPTISGKTSARHRASL